MWLGELLVAVAWFFNVYLTFERLWIGVGNRLLILTLGNGFVSVFWKIILYNVSLLNWIGFSPCHYCQNFPKENWNLGSFYKVPSEVTPYPYKSTIRPCAEYYYHIWNDALSSCLHVLEKQSVYLELLILHLLVLFHWWLIIDMWLVCFIGITLGDVLLKWLNWFLFLILVGGLPVILISYQISPPMFRKVIQNFLVKFNMVTSKVA